MSNIRTIRDLEAPPQAARSNALPPARPYNSSQRRSDSGAAYSFPDGPVAEPFPQFGAGGAVVQQPVPPTIGEMCCPRWNWLSFTLIVSAFQVVMFIVALIIGATMFDGAFVKGNKMGGPSTQTFNYLGGKNRQDIHDGQVWRLVTPIFLHGGLLHLASNLFFQLSMGFTFEATWGTKRFIAMYFVSGIGGNLVSCLCAPHSVSVGASGALYGLLGAQLAYLMLNWSQLLPDFRLRELIQLIIVLLLNFFISFVDPIIDVWGHVGGFIFGILAGCSFGLLIAPDDSTRQKTIQTTSLLLLTCLTITFTVVIFVTSP